MRKLLMLAAVGVLFSGVSALMAADDKKVTVTGDGMCAKCALKETKTCQNVVIEEQGRQEDDLLPRARGRCQEGPSERWASAWPPRTTQSR